MPQVDLKAQDDSQLWHAAPSDRTKGKTAGVHGSRVGEETADLANAEIHTAAEDRDKLRRELEKEIEEACEELSCLTELEQDSGVQMGAVDSLIKIMQKRFAVINPFRPMEYCTDPDDASIVLWPAVWLLRPVFNLAVAVGMTISSPLLFAAAHHKDQSQPGRLQVNAFVKELNASNLTERERDEIVEERSSLLERKIASKTEELEKLGEAGSPA